MYPDKHSSLFTSVQMGGLNLPNRIVMAPLTRMRATSSGHVPTELQARYYAQRTSAGLIVGECTSISPDAVGWADTPGLWSAEQVRGWRGVTDAVHAKGGRIIAQLWHTGAMSHPDFFDGAPPMSASDINPEQESVTPFGRKATVAPRPMSKRDIRDTVRDYGRAARNAMEAGFDGVQLQANYLYLIAQFLNRGTNKRTDEYGGSIENRARLLFESLESILNEVDASQVGIKVGPMHLTGPFAANEETLPTAEYVLNRINDYDLSHLLLMGATTDFSDSPIAHLTGDGMFRHFRNIYRGTLIANVDMDVERAHRLITGELADMVAFGRPYISNPDLVERLSIGAPLNEIDWSSVYASSAHGYIDYPTLEQVIA